MMFLTLFIVVLLSLQTAFTYPRTVLIEEYTSTTCAPCAVMNAWFDPIIYQTPRTQMVVIKYHMNWPSPGNDPWYTANPTQSLTRRNYYSVNAVPTPFIDGTQASLTQSIFVSSYNARRQVVSPIWLKLSSSMNATGDSLVCVAQAVASSPITGTNVIRFALVENHEVWSPAAPNGETEFPYPFIHFSPGPAGIPFTHTGNTSDTLTFRVAFAQRNTGPQPFTLDNCGFVGWVQNETSREVLQSIYKNFSPLQYPVGGETVYIGSTMGIRWDTQSFSSDVGLSLNRNWPSGIWEGIAMDLTNNGLYNWTVTGPSTANAKVRIESMMFPEEMDMSKTVFTITSPAQVTVTPNPISVSVPEGTVLPFPVTVNNNSSNVYNCVLTPELGTDGYLYDLIEPNPVDVTAATAGPIGDDAMGGPYILPFSFPFFGQTYSQVYMCTNGFISFQSFTASATYTNTALPASFANTVIAPFWDDLNVTGAGFTRVLLDGANQRAIFSWNGVQRYGDAGSNLNFQIHLYANGYIELHYPSVTGTLNSATVGLQGSPTNYVQVLYNSTIPTNNAYYFLREYRWGTVTPSTFNVPANASATFTLNLNATSLIGDTTLVGWIQVGGSTVPFNVPVTMYVVSTSVSDLNSLPIEFTLSEPYPNPFNATTKIQFSIPKVSQVVLKLFDLNGREVMTILNGELNAGQYQHLIRAEHLSSGTYLLRMQVGNEFTSIRKVVLLK